MSTAATGALHPELTRLAAEIRATLTDVESLCANLSEDQFNWHPAPARWSIAQCLTHLNTLNVQDLAPMSAAIANATAHSLGPYNYSWIWRYFIKTMEPPVKTKFRVPKSYEPPPEAPLATTLAEYRRISTELLELIRRANGLDLERVKTPMPAIKFLKMPLGARLALLTAHNRRHLEQARDVVRTLPTRPR